MTMSAIFTNITGAVTGITGLVGDVVSTITSEPLLMIFIGVSLLGTAIGIVRRFI